MKYLFLLITFLLISGTEVLAQQQDLKLAQYYYKQGEYEKSADLFKKLSDRSGGYNEYYFNQYIESLMALEDYDQAIAEIQKTLEARPHLIPLYVTYGNLLERQAQVEEAENQYRLAIANIGPDRGMIGSLGNSFMRLTKYDLALEVFEKGEKLLGNSGVFAFNVAEIYRRKNDKDQMIHFFLQSTRASLQRINSVQDYFSRYLHTNEDYEILRKKLYEKVQEDPENIFYPEMIEWVFIKNKDYDKALRQARALDRRLGENGARIYSLAQIASNARDYDTAIKAYDYILASKDPQSGYFIDSKENFSIQRERK